MDRTKVFFTLTDEAIEVINRRAPSPHKRGDWLSGAILDYDRIVTGATTGDSDKGLLEQVVIRLSHIEKQLAAIITKQGCV